MFGSPLCEPTEEHEHASLITLLPRSLEAVGAAAAALPATSAASSRGRGGGAPAPWHRGQPPAPDQGPFLLRPTVILSPFKLPLERPLCQGKVNQSTG